MADIKGGYRYTFAKDENYAFGISAGFMYRFVGVYLLDGTIVSEVTPSDEYVELDAEFGLGDSAVAYGFVEYFGDFEAGIGVRFDISENLGLRAEYENGPDLEAVRLGINFNF